MVSISQSLYHKECQRPVRYTACLGKPEFEIYVLSIYITFNGKTFQIKVTENISGYQAVICFIFNQVNQENYWSIGDYLNFLLFSRTSFTSCIRQLKSNKENVFIFNQLCNNVISYV